ncbi:hypothetical protein TREES_T100016164 [Tupaia chinensis]|uniref:Claudin n=1 Tax=Tupaia chinensis TaxID=246437 RepID=L9JNT8_TUPCH|nr:hypothetical protein TREES_T100016164 [Tupaia chinensis]
MSRAQITALVAGVGGFGALVAATTSNEWKVTTRASSVITATWVYQGLWMNCAGPLIKAFTRFLVQNMGCGDQGRIAHRPLLRGRAACKESTS